MPIAETRDWIDEVDLSECRRICEEATGGDWVSRGDAVYKEDEHQIFATIAMAVSERNGKFIAYARTALPALVDQCEWLMRELQKAVKGEVGNGKTQENHPLGNQAPAGWGDD